tara:strand:- start:162 stop:272 length:111 start_codon:yes stop_codon:yes gene_type:complete
MTAYWTTTTSYGDIEIKWEFKEAEAEKETFIYLLNE